MVSEQVRAAEAAIDEEIRHLPVWKGRKTALLRRFMNIWRNGVDLAYMKFAHGEIFQSEDSFAEGHAIEQQTNMGIYWCLKWTFQFAQTSSRWKPTDEQLTDLVMREGFLYQSWVDALKFARVGGNEIDVDTATRTIKIYEGGNLSGYDDTIVDLDRHRLPLHKQNPLVEDFDQLTKRWIAGNYREYWRWLSNFAEHAETETFRSATRSASSTTRYVQATSCA